MTNPADRRRFVAAGAALLIGTGLRSPAAAQPRIETARILCGYPPGGVADLMSRTIAERLAGRLGTAVVVDNRPGAAGRIAVDELRRAPADGSVMLLTPASVMTLYPHVYRQLSYDPLVDVAPVATVANTAFALAIGPKVPASVTDVEGFVRWCRAHPQDAQCGNAGAGSMQHLLATLVARELGVGMVHVPYKGGPAAMQAAAGGEIAAALAPENSARASSTAGRLRVIATTTAERSTVFPESPTFRELGWPALAQREWFGVFMPARTPATTIEAAARALRQAVDAPELRGAWQRAGLGTESLAPAQLATTMREELGFWGPLVRASGFTPES